MARTNSNLLLRGLAKLRGAVLRVPEQSTPAQTDPRPEKGSSPLPSAKRTSTAAPDGEAGTQTAVPDDSDKNTPKKKVPAQPWYRHRQRW